MKDQVRRMAENDEPKCKNCKQWGPLGDDTAYGECGLRKAVTVASVPCVTTDLSLCSAWEHKTD